MQFTKVRHDTKDWDKITIPKLYLGWFEKEWFKDGWFSQDIPKVFTKVRHNAQYWTKIDH